MNSIIFGESKKSKDQINDFSDEMSFRRIQMRALLFSEIQAMIEGYIRQEQLLLSRLIELKAELFEPSLDGEKSARSELRGDIVGERTLARRGKRVTQVYVEQKHFIETTHQQYLDNILLYLRGISVIKPRLKEPNSQTLVNKVNKAQKYAKIESRIRNTIIALRKIANKDLLPNAEITRANVQDLTDEMRETQQISYKMRNLKEHK